MEPQNDHGAALSFEAFRSMVAEQLQIDEARVTPEASFVRDLAADSIQLVELMLKLEEQGVSIPLEAAWDVETVGQAYQMYVEHAAPKEG